MLRCALLSVSVGTAFRILRDPGLCPPLGSGAGPILIVGCSDKLRDSLAKKRLAIWIKHLTNGWVHFDSLVELGGETLRLIVQGASTPLRPTEMRGINAVVIVIVRNGAGHSLAPKLVCKI